jgi:predicted DNA-binding protein
MPCDPITSIRLPLELRVAVTDLADRRGVSRSAVVREALEALMRRDDAERKAA